MQSSGIRWAARSVYGPATLTIECGDMTLSDELAAKIMVAVWDDMSFGQSLGVGRGCRESWNSNKGLSYVGP